MRDVHRRLAYAIDIQMMIVKLFIRDLKHKAKVQYTVGMLRAGFHFKRKKTATAVFFPLKYS